MLLQCLSRWTSYDNSLYIFVSLQIQVEKQWNCLHCFYSTLWLPLPYLPIVMEQERTHDTITALSTVLVLNHTTVTHHYAHTSWGSGKWWMKPHWNWAMKQTLMNVEESMEVRVYNDIAIIISFLGGGGASHPHTGWNPVVSDSIFGHL